MPVRRKARPKNYLMYEIATFTRDAVCHIHCCPQQRWEVTELPDNKVKLYKGDTITLIIPKEDFEKHWIVIE